MFPIIQTALTNIAIGLAGLGAAAGLLAFVIALLINYWGILDPRMGAMVKGALLKIALTTVVLAALAAGGVALMTF